MTFTDDPMKRIVAIADAYSHTFCVKITSPEMAKQVFNAFMQEGYFYFGGGTLFRRMQNGSFRKWPVFLRLDVFRLLNASKENARRGEWHFECRVVSKPPKEEFNRTQDVPVVSDLDFLRVLRVLSDRSGEGS